jgi:hypothetical protein
MKGFRHAAWCGDGETIVDGGFGAKRTSGNAL